jgi:hypothetical protein
VITPFCRDHANLKLEELTVDLVQAFLESITKCSQRRWPREPGEGGVFYSGFPESWHEQFNT